MNNTSLTKEKEIRFAILEAQFRKFSNFLTKFGYELNEIIVDNDPLYVNPKLEAKYLKSDREVELTYHYLNRKNDLVDTIGGSITRKPYRNEDDFINLGLLLQKNCKKYQEEFLSLENYNGDLQSKAEQLFDNLKKCLEQCAKEVLSGKEWETGLYLKWN